MPKKANYSKIYNQLYRVLTHPDYVDESNVNRFFLDGKSWEQLGIEQRKVNLIGSIEFLIWVTEEFPERLPYKLIGGDTLWYKTILKVLKKDGLNKLEKPLVQGFQNIFNSRARHIAYAKRCVEELLEKPTN